MKTEGLYHRAQGRESRDNPVILRGFTSPGTCPQLLKEPDLWQEPMISAVINKTVKLINPSLCSQGKTTIYYQYCYLLIVDQSLRCKPSPLGTQGHHWLMPLVRFYLVTLPMFINKPYCNKSFDDMTSGLTGLYNLVVFLAETDRPMNPSVYHL